MARKTRFFLDFVQYGELSTLIENEWESILQEHTPKSSFAKRAELSLGFPVSAQNVTMVCAKKDWIWPTNRCKAKGKSDRVRALALLLRKFINEAEAFTKAEDDLLDSLCDGKSIMNGKEVE